MLSPTFSELVRNNLNLEVFKEIFNSRKCNNDCSKLRECLKNHEDLIIVINVDKYKLGIYIDKRIEKTNEFVKGNVRYYDLDNEKEFKSKKGRYDEDHEYCDLSFYLADNEECLFQLGVGDLVIKTNYMADAEPNIYESNIKFRNQKVYSISVIRMQKIFDQNNLEIEEKRCIEKCIEYSNDKLMNELKKYIDNNFINEETYEMEEDINENIKILDKVFDKKHYNSIIIERKIEMGNEIINDIQKLLKDVISIHKYYVLYKINYSKEINELIDQRIKLEREICDKRIIEFPRKIETYKEKYLYFVDSLNEMKLDEIKRTDIHIDPYTEIEKLKQQIELQKEDMKENWEEYITTNEIEQKIKNLNDGIKKLEEENELKGKEISNRIIQFETEKKEIIAEFNDVCETFQEEKRLIYSHLEKELKQCQTQNQKMKEQHIVEKEQNKRMIEERERMKKEIEVMRERERTFEERIKEHEEITEMFIKQTEEYDQELAKKECEIEQLKKEIEQLKKGKV